MAFQPAARLAEIWDGDMKACSVGGRKVVLVHLDNRVYAYEDRCAHLGVPLSMGRLKCGVLICSAHLYEYDARSGHSLNPRNVCLKSFPVRIEDGVVLIDAE